MKVLVVVDMQNDFIDGALGTKEAEAIVPKVVEKIRNFDGQIYFTKDTHGEDYMDTQEGKNLPVPHCIKGTKGWEYAPQIMELARGPAFEKGTFGSLELGRAIQALDRELKAGNGSGEESGVESVTLVGLCTDICVISNALVIKAHVPEIPVIVDAACCAGVTPESHRQALKAMKMCQIQVAGE